MKKAPGKNNGPPFGQVFARNCLKRPIEIETFKAESDTIKSEPLIVSNQEVLSREKILLKKEKKFVTNSAWMSSGARQSKQ